MNYSAINKDNILEIIKYVDSNRASCEKITKELNKNIETTIIATDKHKHIIRDLSQSIKVLVVDCQKNVVANMTFYGLLIVTHSDLVRLFGEERSVYNFHDDITFHFFNENNSNYTVSYFSDGNVNSDLNLEAGLSNLSITLLPVNIN